MNIQEIELLVKGQQIICEGFLSYVQETLVDNEIMICSPPKVWRITPEYYHLLEMYNAPNK